MTMTTINAETAERAEKIILRGFSEFCVQRRRSPARRHCSAPGCHRSASVPRKASPSSTARSRPRRCWRSRWRRPIRWRAPPTSPRPCRLTRCADQSIRSRRASMTRSAVPRPADARLPTSKLLMRGSGINHSHEHCGKVQDAYSLRCAAQVHGAARDALRFVRDTLNIEINSATDNPMVFAGQRTTSCRAATSMARRLRSLRTCWPPRSCRWRPSANGGPTGWSIRP